MMNGRDTTYLLYAASLTSGPHGRPVLVKGRGNLHAEESVSITERLP
jgi:hypothetical protein